MAEIKPNLTRRDFLKLAALVPLGVAARPLTRPRAGQRADGLSNVLIVVFDAFSARHISLHGYGRSTTPHLARLAKRAIVYHNHYAASDFTTPGTASLLTGTLPWTHRALRRAGRLSGTFPGKTIFRAFDQHHRVVYSHNPWIYTLCDQFAGDLDEYIPLDRLLLTGHGQYDGLFAHDADIAGVAWERAMEKNADNAAYTLYLSSLRSAYVRRRLAPLEPYFPLGVPLVGGKGHFLLEDAIDWLQREAPRFPQPYLGYVHLLPPHVPFAPSEDFYRFFAGDGFRPPSKPVHLLVSDTVSEPELLRLRREYDEFILNVDHAFGQLLDQLEAAGALENTWIVLTSDHGEMFERGFTGHIGPMLYEPVIRIPLMIFEPGRRTRLDVHTATSAVDLLPTLLHVTGQPAAGWTEGSLLPPFSPSDADRPVFALYADKPNPRQPLTRATAAIVRGEYKLIHMFGYPELGATGERLELYDLEKDPEELVDLSSARRDVVGALLQELTARIKEADQHIS